MDKPIQKKFWTPGRVLLIVCSLLILASLSYLVATRSGKSRLKVDPSRMTFSKVGMANFANIIPSTQP